MASSQSQDSPFHFKHNLMLSCFTASVELAILKEPEKYDFIFHDEICARIGGPLQFQMPNRKWLKPDRAFGIRYKADGSVRIFLVEADRGTEQNKASMGRKTAEENLAEYRTFLTNGYYRTPMKWNGGVLLLMLFSAPGKMANVMEYLKKMTNGGANYVLFREMPGFGTDLQPPLPTDDFFTLPYQRSGREGFYINKE